MEILCMLHRMHLGFVVGSDVSHSVVNPWYTVGNWCGAHSHCPNYTCSIPEGIYQSLKKGLPEVHRFSGIHVDISKHR